MQTDPRRKKSARKTRPPLPEDVEQQWQNAYRQLGNTQLRAGVRGRFLYVMHDWEPLCRLSYLGEQDRWELAVYKYSTGSYGRLDFHPPPAPMADCILAAMSLYNLV